MASPRTRKRSYTVQAVVRACAVLRAFSQESQVLKLHDVVARTKLNKGTAFRLLETMVETGWLDRVGNHAYRPLFRPVHAGKFRIGYGSQSNLLPFIGVVTESLRCAASAAGVDLVVLDNRLSPRISLKNAERFVKEKVDLVIEFQINYGVAAQISAKFMDAGIPFIAVDIPHPGGTYFGADNYKAGHLTGRHLARCASKAWGGEATQIVYLGVDAAGPLLNSRLMGVRDGLAEVLPATKRLPSVHYDTKGGQFDVALDLMRKHLRRRKVRRVLLGAVSDPVGLGALQAFREVGLENECKIVGQGACVEVRHELRRQDSAFVATVAYFPETYGERLIHLAIDILEKKRVPLAIFAHHELVTAENVNRIFPNDAWLFSGSAPGE